MAFVSTPASMRETVSAVALESTKGEGTSLIFMNESCRSKWRSAGHRHQSRVWMQGGVAICGSRLGETIIAILIPHM